MPRSTCLLLLLRTGSVSRYFHLLSSWDNRTQIFLSAQAPLLLESHLKPRWRDVVEFHELDSFALCKDTCLAWAGSDEAQNMVPRALSDARKGRAFSQPAGGVRMQRPCFIA